AEPAETRAAQGDADAAADRMPAQERLEELERKAAERDEYLELLQRVRADFANYQKRVQKERETDRRYAPLPLVAGLLGVLVNFERAIEAAEAEQASPGLLQGIRMIYHQLMETLQRHGVQPIEAEGRPFDPDVHEAVMKENTDQAPPGTIVRVLQQGYKLHERVVRPAKVVVAAMPEGVEEAAAEQEEPEPPSDGRQKRHAQP
ncbi:MAG TPA: nucleotide exchange factor GrpE, partial [Planctomycetaceae bacterium]|nr:nucleotide exchange factor GrpE [Planctomycetaceae bacterium]